MKNKTIKLILLIIVIIGIGFFAYKKAVAPVKNIPNSTNQITLDQEKGIVEKYIRDNIKTIATDKAVLGGSWYVLSVNINPATKSGSVVYEDGHIQSKATFTYTFDNQIVKITGWKVGK